MNTAGIDIEATLWYNQATFFGLYVEQSRCMMEQSSVKRVTRVTILNADKVGVTITLSGGHTNTPWGRAFAEANTPEELRQALQLAIQETQSFGGEATRIADLNKLLAYITPDPVLPGQEEKQKKPLALSQWSIGMERIPKEALPI